MIYFTDNTKDVYAFYKEDLEHDEQVKSRIAELEAEKLNPPEQDEAGNSQDYDALINQLRSTIRIGGELTPISEQEAQQLVAPSPEEMDDQKTKAEHTWVQSELESVQIELMYHWTDDERASFTLEVWKQYTRDLRNYTTTDDSGIISVVGDTRPSRPH
ncbi:hypothetical protein AL536_02595 [Vibrio fluvialis]|uniref:Uncharacterized protein n=1 Tax=Vibrio fluvialis TaxID=676 RepID=A0AAX2LY19_VIBFL|nr:hypothetical protein [Vibrio fluvialis]AMF92387.1 hypothetical protein AL536_02595 [Vibrio fluvialis]EKO4009447.1 hypothetical protein [Vibrio fluvialis]MBY8225838.1 hypothetical protein [Vibrio fluvialis]MCE7635603.1 hypothetical protein [Vibrio fluvialis]SUQ27226.1 Uncharacterised protein [Vibrio fluvialis]